MKANKRGGKRPGSGRPGRGVKTKSKTFRMDEPWITMAENLYGKNLTRKINGLLKNEIEK